MGCRGTRMGVRAQGRRVGKNSGPRGGCGGGVGPRGFGVQEVGSQWAQCAGREGVRRAGERVWSPGMGRRIVGEGGRESRGFEEGVVGLGVGSEGLGAQEGGVRLGPERSQGRIVKGERSGGQGGGGGGAPGVGAGAGEDGARGAHRTHDAHDALPQQPRVDVIGALAAALGRKMGVRVRVRLRGQPCPQPRSAPASRAGSPRGRCTVCSTTMGMSGRARAAVACRLRRRTRPLSGARCGGKRAARRGPSAGHLPAATRAPPTNTPAHIASHGRPGFRPMAELQLPACFAPTALAHYAARFREAGRARLGAGRIRGRSLKGAGPEQGLKTGGPEVSEPPVLVPGPTNSLFLILKINSVVSPGPWPQRASSLVGTTLMRPSQPSVVTCGIERGTPG